MRGAASRVAEGDTAVFGLGVSSLKRMCAGAVPAARLASTWRV